MLGSSAELVNFVQSPMFPITESILRRSCQPCRSAWLLTLFLIGLSACPHLVSASDLPRLHRLTLDGLKAEANRGPGNWEVELAIVRKLGQENPAEALARLDTIPAAELSRSLQVVARAYYCEQNIRRGESELAQPYCQNLEDEIGGIADDPQSQALALNSLGYFYVRAGQAEQTLRQFETALQLLDLEDEVLKVHLLHNRGVALMLSGLPELSIEAFNSANEAKTALASDEMLPTILAYNLGYVQAQAGNHIEALKSYESTIPWLEQTGQLTRAYISHTQVALSYSGLGRHQEALDELLPWLDRSDFSVTPDSEAQAQLALAEAYLGLGNEVRAEQVLLQGIDIATQSNNPARLRELSLVYAELLLNRGEPEAAAEYLNDLFRQFALNDLRAGLEPAHSLLAMSYEAMGDLRTALVHSQLAIESLRESQSEAYSRRLASLRVNNELELETQELALALERGRLELASRRLTQLIQMLALASLLAFIIFVYLYLSRDANQREAQIQRRVADQLKEEVTQRSLEVERALKQKYASEKRKAELEIRVARDDKLRAIGQLTGGVAHDFNNIMTVIQLSCEYLLSNLSSAQGKVAEDILTAVNSGKAITRDLLAYGRQQVLQPSSIDLKQYISANKTLFARSIDESYQLDTYLDDSSGPLLIVVDSGQLTSSIINLVLNAREASSAGGRILLSISRLADQVIIEVTDSGRGMTAKEVETATEPFYTTKSFAEGTGLGLSMVEGFIKQSGAEMSITSKIGQGTTVRLVFAVANAPGKPPQRESKAVYVDSEITILLVEDEEQIRSVAAMVLESKGYKVVTATDSADALEKLPQIESLSLLITDQIMPGDMPGDKLILKIRESLPELPALLISGYSENIPTDYPFLAKPFSTGALLSKVRELVAYQSA